MTDHPLTHAQRRVWYTEELYGHSPVTSISFTYRFPAPVPREALEDALNACLEANDALRLRFLERPDPAGEFAVRQRVAPHERHVLPEHDFSGDDGEARYQAWARERAAEPFPHLHDRPLLFAASIRLPGDGSALFLKLHHLISDGQTTQLLPAEIGAFLEHGTLPPKPSYLEYLAAEQEYLESPRCEADHRWWMETLSPLPTPPDISFRRARAGSLRAERQRLAVPTELRASLHAFAARRRTSLFKLVLSGLSLQLSRLTRTRDLVMSTADSGRATDRERATMGMFVNLLPLRLGHDPDASFEALADGVGRRVNEILKQHSRYPYDRLATDLGGRFGHLLLKTQVVTLVGHPDLETPIRMEHHFSGHQATALVIHLNPDNRDHLGHLDLAYDYQVDLFEPEDIRDLHEGLMTLLAEAVADPLRTVGTLDIVSPRMRERLLVEFAGPTLDLDASPTFVSLFEDQAARSPDALAVAAGDARMTFRELDERANGLARTLRGRALPPGSVIAIMAPPSLEMVVGLVGIMKAGCGYMPIDPKYPADRMRHMLETSGSPLLIGPAGAMPGFTGASIDLLGPELATPVPARFAPNVRPHDPAYLIFTSGSTGTPKGALIEQRALVNHCLYSRERLGLTPADRYAKAASFGFDATVLDIFPTLAAGASVWMVPDEVRVAPIDLDAFITRHGLTVCFLTTQLGETFMELTDNRALRMLVVGGEKLVRCPPRAYDVLNIYGPTEYTVYTTSWLAAGDRSRIPIGTPVANTRVYVLDEHDHLQPVGAPGELCVAGAGIARGYIHDPERTARQFVGDPFFPGERMYRTGDLARYLPDGNLECLGRIDDQVKVRGYRIEPGEIESRLMRFPGIRQAAVVAHPDANGNKYLCGYFVADAPVETGALKAFLGQALPEYMVPPFLLPMDRLPVSPNGKIDRRALPTPAASVDASVEHVPPATPLEESLAALWEEILGVGRIGVLDDFFALGGHSLKAATLQARLQVRLGVRVPLQRIFAHPTVRQLARFVGTLLPGAGPGAEPAGIASGAGPGAEPAGIPSGAGPGAEPPGIPSSAEPPGIPSSAEPEGIPSLGDREWYELSGAQRRLFVIQQMDRIGTTYNVPLVLRLKGPLHLRRLADAFEALVARHEALRTSFDMVDGRPMQRIHATVKVRKERREVTEEGLPSAIRAFVRPFDLSRAPLLRACLFHMGPESHALVIDVHHIIFDGMSLGVLMRELAELYAGRALPPVRVQYKEFAAWQNERLEGDEARANRAFWTRAFQDEVPVLELPTDHPRPSSLDYRGDEVKLVLDEALVADLHAFCGRHGVTLHALLATTFGVLLARYTGQQDVVVGTPVAGRVHPDIAETVGFFVNTLPVRMRPADGRSFRELLVEVRDFLLEAYDHQEYPLERLIDDLRIGRDASRNPLIDAALVFQEEVYPSVRLDDLLVEVEPAPYDTAKFDLLLEAVERGRAVDCYWYYRTSLFDRATPERMHRHFVSLLRSVLADASRRVADLDMLSLAEEHVLLDAYNQTTARYPRHATIHGLFEEQVARVPDRVAVTFQGTSLTYRELDRRANRLAWHLRSRGVGRESIVGMLMDRSLEMIVGIMGILKAGGAYLPINPEHPADRIAYTLENSGTPWLVTTGSHADVPFDGERVLFEGEAEWDVPDDVRPESLNEPGDLAYIIYTSGSTGRPKGVMIDHHNVVRLMHNDAMPFAFGPDDVWTMFHSYCFDFSVWEMYGALLHGGRLVVVPRSAALSPREFLGLVESEGVTVLNQTPGAFYNLIAEEREAGRRDLRLRYVVFGGEALKPIMLRDFQAWHPETTLVNMYGITETTVHVTFKVITREEVDANRSNIGLPIPTLTCYLMDRNLRLVPVGVAGEICVGGEGVARGYLHMEELTARRFVPNPYRPSERLYRSGDLARRLPDGEMEYFGRMDFQVKVRGFRVELGEIENQLLRHPEVEKAVVIAVDDPDGGKSLAAYLVMRADQTVPQLRAYLGRELPDYMIPSWFVKLEEMPLTSNGKVDRRALPDPHGAVDLGTTFEEARNDAERAIARAWAKVLGLGRVGVRDSFFALGGHSLKAVTLAAELQKQFAVTVNDIFEHQTVAELAAVLRPHEHDLRARLAEVRERVLASLAEAAAPPETDETRAARDRYLQGTADLLGRLEMPVEDAAAGASPLARDVLVTGATGYLGVYLVRDLLVGGTARVRAIVRGSSDVDARARVLGRLERFFGAALAEQARERLDVQCGDLSQPRLGLSAEAWDGLAREVECIVHAAANVRHYGHYEEFHAANVRATVNLLALAETGRPKRFHHVSTSSVAYGDTPGRAFVRFTEDECDVGQQPTNYYVKSKLEAERAVLGARARGVAASIHRIGNITYDSRTGRFQENIEDNAFYRQVKAFVNLGLVPEADDAFECSFVDQVSRSMLLLAGRPELDGRTWHIVSPHEVKMSRLLVDERLGLGVRSVPFGAFIDALVENYEREGFREHIEDVMLHKGWLSDDFAAGTRYEVPCDRTLAVLGRLGFEWSPVDPRVMRPMIVEGLRGRVELLGQVALFAGVDREALETLACRGRLQVVPEDADLVWEEQPSDELHVIVRGAVELTRHSASGWLGLISVLGRGEFVGESGVLGAATSPVTVRAVLDDAVVLSFPRAAIEPLLTTSPGFVRAFLHQMEHRLRKVETLLVNMG